MKTLFNLLLNAMFALLIGTAVGQTYDVNALHVGIGIAASGLVLQHVVPQGVALMGIQREIWTNLIRENLFKDNAFLNFALNADGFVNEGRFVHIPAAGQKPNVSINRESLPAVVKRRADIDLIYALDEFTTDPVLIQNAEKIELAYDKIMSVLGDHLATLSEEVAEQALVRWVSASLGQETTLATQLRTTGGNVAAHLPSATGNRNKFLKEDLKSARKLMNKNNIPKESRYALIDSDMFDQLQDDADLKVRDNSMELDMKNGVIDRLYGFNIMERSTVLRYNNAGTPVVKLPDAAGASTDNAAVLCWQASQVERALGTVDFFEDQRNPTYYGDVYSGLVRFGGRIRRAQGVVAIIQGT